MVGSEGSISLILSVLG